MSKSLKARCIRRWQVEFKGRCNSKFSMVWVTEFKRIDGAAQ